MEPQKSAPPDLKLASLADTDDRTVRSDDLDGLRR